MSIRTTNGDGRISTTTMNVPAGIQKAYRYWELYDWTHMGGYFHGVHMPLAVEQAVDFYNTFYRLTGKQSNYPLGIQVVDMTPISQVSDLMSEKNYIIRVRLGHKVKPPRKSDKNERTVTDSWDNSRI